MKESKIKLLCPNCKSMDVVKTGIRYNKSGKKQRYLCNKCKVYFVPDNGFKKMRFDPEVVTKAVHLYVDGLSISKVQNYLLQHEGVKVSDVSILNWVRKYASILKKESMRY